MQIKFGRMWGNSLTLSRFEKKARRTTDLVASVNYNSRPDRRDEMASSAAPLNASNQVLFVVFNAVECSDEALCEADGRRSLSPLRLSRKNGAREKESGAP